MGELTEKLDSFKTKLENKKGKKRDRWRRKNDVRAWLNDKDNGKNIRSRVATDAYREGWERIFGKKKKDEESKPAADGG